MKICISAQHPTPESPVDPRFGRARCFMVYDEQDDTWSIVDNVQNLEAAQGAGIQSAATVVNAGCNVLISGHCGPKAFAALARAGVMVHTVTGGTVREAVTLLKNGLLPQIDNADVDGHW